jgi:hypothetical protein
VNCSTLRERTAGSPPSTSQVSLIAWPLGTAYRLSKLTTAMPDPEPPRNVKTTTQAFGQPPEATSHITLRTACRTHVANYWAEAHEKIARMTLTIKLDRNWSSFQLANRAPPLSVTDSSIAPSARMLTHGCPGIDRFLKLTTAAPLSTAPCHHPSPTVLNSPWPLLGDPWSSFVSCSDAAPTALKHQGMPKHTQLARAGARRDILTAVVWVKNVNTLLRG